MISLMMAYEKVETCRCWDKLCKNSLANKHYKVVFDLFCLCLWFKMIFEGHILPPANLISALTEQLNPCVVVLRFLKYWVTGKETSIHGRGEKYVILCPENGGRMIVRNTDHHHTARYMKTKDTDRNTLWGLITPTLSRAVLLRLVEWWTGKPLERNGRHLIVILEDLRKTTKSSVGTTCVPVKIRTDKLTIEAFLLLRYYAEQVGSWLR